MARSIRMTPRSVGGATLFYVTGVLLVLGFTFPIVFMIVSSLKPDEQIFLDLTTGNAFLPTGDISLDNYAAVLDRVPVLTFLSNSVIVSAAVVVLGLVVNSLAGFAIARLRWRGKTVFLGAVIALLIVPFETIAIPMVFWVSRLPTVGWDAGFEWESGMFNTYTVQILPFVANSFSIFLFAQYFRSLPRELDEAAIVDGASWFRVYRQVVVPLSGPVFATAAILTFLPIWNAYLWPVMVIQREELRPVQVGLSYFFQNGSVAWGEVMAYTTMITLPVIVLFVGFQRAFVASIASTGIKG